MDIHVAVTQAMQSILANSIIRNLMFRKVHPKQYVFFVTQKTFIRSYLTRLLTIVLSQNQPCYPPKIIAALQENLNDELGIDGEGKVQLGLSHAHWEENFLRALDITPEMIKQVEPLPATKRFLMAIDQLIIQNKPFVILGAILMTRRLIPLEFRALQISRDFLFPNRFIISKADSKEVVLRKQQACQYIDDHIMHDANEHYSDLLKAIEERGFSFSEWNDILKGIHIIKEYRNRFYNNIGRYWPVGDHDDSLFQDHKA